MDYRIPITISNFSAKKFDRLKIGSLSIYCELNSDIYRVETFNYQESVFAQRGSLKTFIIFPLLLSAKTVYILPIGCLIAQSR